MGEPAQPEPRQRRLPQRARAPVVLSGRLALRLGHRLAEPLWRLVAPPGLGGLPHPDPVDGPDGFAPGQRIRPRAQIGPGDRYRGMTAAFDTTDTSTPPALCRQSAESRVATAFFLLSNRRPVVSKLFFSVRPFSFSPSAEPSLRRRAPPSPASAFFSSRCSHQTFHPHLSVGTAGCIANLIRRDGSHRLPLRFPPPPVEAGVEAEGPLEPWVASFCLALSFFTCSLVLGGT